MAKKINCLALLFLIGLSSHANAADKLLIKIAYLSQEREAPAALSNLDPFIQNKGELGAELATSDNNTTGQFTHQQYELKKVIVPIGGDIVQAFNKLGDDVGFVVLNVKPAQINQLADLPAAQNKLLFDAVTSDDELRGSQCRHHVLHILPNRAMRADALAQYMLKKRWQNWFLVVGQTPEDQLYAAAIKRAAKRYGMKLVAEKAWDNTYDARRSAQSDVPQFTQGEDYDVAVRAIGEASVRAKSDQVQTIKDYMLSDAFALQGYKGKPLTFRSWDGQLRQPILLAAPRSMVSVAPLDGFLHPKSELDTLGYDQPESTCK
jgi:hypothetical protein